MRKTCYGFSHFWRSWQEFRLNFSWCRLQNSVSYYNFHTIEIIEIPVEKAARFAKSETRDYRGDCLVLISVTNKYLVFKIYGISHYASLYSLWMRQTTTCFIHLLLYSRKLVSFFALGTIDILCKHIFRLFGPRPPPPT